MLPPVHVCLRALALFSYQLEVRACAEKKSVCTAVYLTQMFLLDLKCLFVRSGLPDPLVLFIF